MRNIVCFNSLSEFLGPSKNQSSPVSGNTVVTAVSLAIGGGKLVQNSLTFAQRTEHPLTSAGWRSRVGSTGGSLGDQHKAQEETGLVSGLKDHKYHSEAPPPPEPRPLAATGALCQGASGGGRGGGRGWRQNPRAVTLKGIGESGSGSRPDTGRTLDCRTAKRRAPPPKFAHVSRNCCRGAQHRQHRVRRSQQQQGVKVMGCKALWA